MSDTSVTLDQIVSLAKRRGFVYPTSEIYGGLANSYDYGPLGAELMRKIRNLWWQFMIEKRDDMVGLDSQIMLHPQTWVASGHVASFTDPLVEDKISHKRYRADHLIEAWVEAHPDKVEDGFQVVNLNVESMGEFIEKHGIKSPDGNPVTKPQTFNLLFETSIGSVSGEKSKVYLRGETAQGIFSNFKQILDSNRVQLPFGVGQIGKSFRNEITTGQFVFRTLEFEQAEIEYFFDPEINSWESQLESWKEYMWKFVTEVIGLNPEHLRWRQHTDKERSHYSKDTYDLEYLYPMGWKELWGVAYRTNYDLNQHIQFSGATLDYTDPFTQKKIVPHVIEPALGVNRLFLAILCDSYRADTEKQRIVLGFTQQLATYQAAVFPLVRNKPEIMEKAREVYAQLRKDHRISWDDRGNIGKRYLSQDEIGTPWCITIDYQTMEDNTVTLRNRDTTEQKRVSIEELKEAIRNN